MILAVTFLFHTGSIKSYRISQNGYMTIKSFYSILVRLKACANLDQYHLDKRVSIPYWFD